MRAVFLLSAVLLAALLAGCAPQRRGASSLTVQTTLPEHYQLWLFSVERPSDVPLTAEANPAGDFIFLNLRPGRYRLEMKTGQFSGLALDNPRFYVPSDPIEVFSGSNRISWSPGQKEVRRLDRHRAP